MFPKKSDWTLLYCWNGKQSMWELCDCIELTLILATGIKVDRTQYRHTHTHKSRITKNSWNSFSSHLSLHFGFFWRRKSGRTMGMPKSRLNAEQSKIRLLLVSSLWLCLLVQSIELIHIFLSGADHFQSFFLFIPVMFLEFALKYFQRKSMKGNPFSIGNQIEREWPFDAHSVESDQQIEQKQMKEERTNVHFIDSNSAGLFREWIEQCTQHKMCQKCLKETWSWFFHNFFVSFPRFGHHFDLIRFCCSFSKCYQIKTENISYFFPFLLLDYFRGRNRNVPFPLCALCSHS